MPGNVAPAAPVDTFPTALYSGFTAELRTEARLNTYPDGSSDRTALQVNPRYFFKLSFAVTASQWDATDANCAGDDDRYTDTGVPPASRTPMSTMWNSRRLRMNSATRGTPPAYCQCATPIRVCNLRWTSASVLNCHSNRSITRCDPVPFCSDC